MRTELKLYKFRKIHLYNLNYTLDLVINMIFFFHRKLINITNQINQYAH